MNGIRETVREVLQAPIEPEAVRHIARAYGELKSACERFSNDPVMQWQKTPDVEAKRARALRVLRSLANGNAAMGKYEVPYVQPPYVEEAASIGSSEQYQYYEGHLAAVMNGIDALLHAVEDFGPGLPRSRARSISDIAEVTVPVNRGEAFRLSADLGFAKPPHLRKEAREVSFPSAFKIVHYAGATRSPNLHFPHFPNYQHMFRIDWAPAILEALLSRKNARRVLEALREKGAAPSVRNSDS